MKKIFKMMIIFIVIFIVLFIINFFRNYFILKKIYNLGNKFNATENFRLQTKIHTSLGKTVINYYYKDKKYLYIEENISNDNMDCYYNELIFHDMNSDEYISLTADENGKLIREFDQTKKDKSNMVESFIYCKGYDFNKLLKMNIFKFIREDRENFIINISNQDEYINKKNGLLNKIISVSNNIDLEIVFEKNVVSDKTIDITQYFINE